MNGSGRTGEVVNLVDFDVDGLTNVMKDEIEVGLPLRMHRHANLSEQVSDVILRSSKEIINTDDIVSLGLNEHAINSYHLDQTSTQMTTNETSASAHHNALSSRHNLVLGTKSRSHAHPQIICSYLESTVAVISLFIKTTTLLYVMNSVLRQSYGESGSTHNEFEKQSHEKRESDSRHRFTQTNNPLLEVVNDKIDERYQQKNDHTVPLAHSSVLCHLLRPLALLRQTILRDVHVGVHLV